MIRIDTLKEDRQWLGLTHLGRGRGNDPRWTRVALECSTVFRYGHR